MPVPFLFPRRALISLLGVLATIGAARFVAYGETRLSMSLAPHLAFAPTDLRVRLDVMPSAGNRSLFVVAESADFYRSSEVPLDGEHAPRSVQLQFRGLPGGEYSVWGEVRDVDGRSLATVREDISVIPVARLR